MFLHRGVAAAFALVLLGTWSCTSSPGTGPEDDSPSVESLCESFVEAYCDWADDCGELDEADCVAARPCAKVEEADEDDVDDCVAALEDAECGTVPRDCGGVIEFPDGSGGGGGGGPTGCSGTAPGSYVLAIGLQLGAKKPLYFAAEVSAAGDQLAVSLTPLRTPYRTASDNEGIAVLAPVGPPITLTSDPLGPAGELHLEATAFTAPGAANPFSATDLEATVSLDGTACPAEGRFCGTLQGDVTAPISLTLSGDKNSFAFNAGTPGVVDCAGTTPDPFP